LVQYKVQVSTNTNALKRSKINSGILDRLKVPHHLKQSIKIKSMTENPLKLANKIAREKKYPA
jgi:hypothetical protein